MRAGREADWGGGRDGAGVRGGWRAVPAVGGFGP